jgi:hypothetical protein
MNIDAYRDRDDNSTHPYRCRVEGQLLRNRAGKVWRFRTLKQACEAGKQACEAAKQAAKSPGQLDYERDVARRPTYHDGRPRATWDELSDIARWSWEKASREEQKCA